MTLKLTYNGSTAEGIKPQTFKRSTLNQAELYDRLSQIASDIFDEDALILKPATRATDVQGWDSLSHIRFLLTIEKEFRVKFTTSEVGKLNNVADLVACLEAKLS